jgi:hypothetical protein
MLRPCASRAVAPSSHGLPAEGSTPEAHAAYPCPCTTLTLAGKAGDVLRLIDGGAETVLRSCRTNMPRSPTQMPPAQSRRTARLGSTKLGCHLQKSQPAQPKVGTQVVVEGARLDGCNRDHSCLIFFLAACIHTHQALAE